jgi:hypothetical protein
VGEKSKPSGQGKKPGRSLKEKRAAKNQKQEAQKQAHKSWDAK